VKTKDLEFHHFAHLFSTDKIIFNYMLTVSHNVFFKFIVAYVDVTMCCAIQICNNE